MPVKQFGGAAGATHLPPGLDRGVKQGGTFPTSKFSSTWARLWDGFGYTYNNDWGPDFIYPLSDGNFLLCEPANGVRKINAKTGALIWTNYVSYTLDFVLEHVPTGKIIFSWFGGNITILNADGTVVTLTGGTVNGTVAGLIGNYLILTGVGSTAIYKVDLTTNTKVWSGTPSGYVPFSQNSILIADGSYMYNIYQSASAFQYQKLDMLAATPTRTAVGTMTTSGTVPTGTHTRTFAAPSRKFGNIHFSPVNMAPNVMYKYDLTTLTATSLFSNGPTFILGVDADDNIWYPAGADAGSWGSSFGKNGTTVMPIPDRLQNIGTRDGKTFVAVYLVPYNDASNVLKTKPATMAISSQITV